MYKNGGQIFLFGDERFMNEVAYVCGSPRGGDEFTMVNDISLLPKDKTFILCSYDEDAAIKALSANGFIHNQNYILAVEFVSTIIDEAYISKTKKINVLPSQMLMQTIHDRPIKNFRCTMGLRKVDFSGDGTIHACCGARIAPVIGNLFNDSSVLNEYDSYVSRIVKLSLINNTYSFCSRKKCSGLVAKMRNFEYEDIRFNGADYTNKGEKYPPLATICIDYTCNLKCESCRKDYKRITGDEVEKRELLAQKLSKELMPNVNQVIMAGNGEMFYSPLYRKMWVNKSGVKRKGIIVKSNGMLFNESNWNLLDQGYENIELDISIDGASKEVYEQVRRGGNWDILRSNMEFAGKLCKQGKIKSFVIEFVVQQKNFKDTKRFVQLGKMWNCTGIVFARIYNWGTYSEQDFNENITLFENNGTGKIKSEFREFFQDKIFDDPIVRGIDVFRS